EDLVPTRHDLGLMPQVLTHDPDDFLIGRMIFGHQEAKSAFRFRRRCQSLNRAMRGGLGTQLDGNFEPETGTLPYGALDADLPSPPPAQPLADRKPESRAAESASRRRVRLGELIPDPLDRLGRDPDAGIDHFKPDSSASTDRHQTRPNPDIALGRELDR